MSRTIVVGIDPSLTHTGIVVLEALKTTSGQTEAVVLEKTVFETKPKDGTDEERINSISAKMSNLAERWKDAHFAIEGYAYGAKYAGPILGEVGWALKSAINRTVGRWPTVIPPSIAKLYITAKGNANKVDVAVATLQRYGLTFANEHICDAHGIARTALARRVIDPTTLTSPLARFASERDAISRMLTGKSIKAKKKPKKTAEQD